MNKTNTRLNNIDLLKIICCIAVIIIHVSAEYVTNANKYENEIFFSNLLNCITRFAVPCFIMISGYFAISNIKKDTYTQFYRKKLKTIIIPTLIFSILYFLFYLIIDIIEYLKNGTSIKIGKICDLLVIGNLDYHMWYLYMFIFIFAITPLLWKIKDKLGDKNFNKMGIILLLISIPFALTSTHKFNYDIGFSIYFVGYYILGYTIKNSAKKKSNSKFLIYILLGFTILFINSFLRLNVLKSGLRDNNFVVPFIGNLSFVDNFWILIVIGFIFIYKGFCYLDLKISLSKITKYSLYIYLIHIFVLKVLKIVLNQQKLKITPYIIIPLFTMVIFIISLLLSKFYLIIYKKVDKNDFMENKICNIIKRLSE